MNHKYDVFVSHASEDKESIAIPLYHALKEHSLNVWFDKFELEVGDSLNRKINEGLSNSKFGVVILSKHFFLKRWTQEELNGLVAKENGRDKVILPIWHDVTYENVLEFSPILADKLALDTQKGVSDISYSIKNIIEKNRVNDNNILDASKEQNPVQNKNRNLFIDAITFEEILLKAKELIDNYEILQALKLILSLGEKKIGQKQYLILINLKPELNKLLKRSNTDATSLRLTEIKKEVSNVIDDLLYTYGEKDDIELDTLFKFISEIKKILSKIWNILKINYNKENIVSSINIFDFNNITIAKGISAFLIFAFLTIINIYFIFRNPSNDELLKIESNLSTYNSSKKEQENISITDTSHNMIDNGNIEEKEAIENIDKSSVTSNDKPHNILPGLYVKEKVYPCMVITKDILIEVPIKNINYKKESGLCYNPKKIINLYFADTIDVDTRLNSKMIGFCNN